MVRDLPVTVSCWLKHEMVGQVSQDVATNHLCLAGWVLRGGRGVRDERSESAYDGMTAIDQI